VRQVSCELSYIRILYFTLLTDCRCRQVHWVGQTVGAVVAESCDLARRAAGAVRITYDELPSIITIEVLLHRPLVQFLSKTLQVIS